MSQRYSPYITPARLSQKSLMKSRTPEHLPSPPHSPPPSGIDADAMAQQTIAYMNVLSEHSAAIRACPQPDVYQRVIDQGRVQPRKASWPSLDDCGRDDLRRRMEEIINRTATSAEEYIDMFSFILDLMLMDDNIVTSRFALLPTHFCYYSMTFLAECHMPSPARLMRKPTCLGPFLFLTFT